MAISIQDTNVQAMTLMEKIERKTAKIAIIGLGYVGLPNAVAKAQEGFCVIGYDLSVDKVHKITSGVSYIDDVTSESILELINSGNLTATYDANHLSDADVIVICVPTPVDEYKHPDLQFVESACCDVKNFVKAGALVILESTTYPGTTEEILVPMLQERGLTIGKDVFIAYSPERIDPANKNFNIHNTPVVVGGVTAVCGKLACMYFGEYAIQVSSPSVAEMTKIYENSFRYVNIGFANEMALICENMGIDIWEVINAASTKPFGFMPFYPSSGVGGHCIPVDPYYLSWKVRSLNMQSRMIETAGDINSNMPRYTCQRIMEVLNERGLVIHGSNILIVGITYKKDVSDVRESPALELIAELERLGANVTFWDDHVTSVTVHGKTYHNVRDTETAIVNSDITVVVTNHSDVDYTLIGENATVLFDTKNVQNMLGTIKGEYIRL
ncbi:nucleotide sugar dehydrogenase [Alicyclobacillus fastidiosus]|uniref:Nucleotide sugar dehydrogenase n=1 Tax=Alicyclobacillus fastidiosus TaxID=392011 RepID=A0ABY6ZKW4_9BACL|nr:nucleotide sugar dehydrogenase [Alicyclobacillus fastidiosus]WAH43479.1 nucleotide sugar dehydrogenase [Alicyclobacillus fastidiosus]GMA59641.1 UDP-N-acetyl-D-glucosamine dehydrogenase [Alicyclobacillus fastidiosus]